MNKQKIIFSLLLLVLFSLLGITTSSTSKQNVLSSQSVITVTPKPTVSQSEQKMFLVKRVVDGDTIELDSGQKVRYIGMNTPETVDPRRGVQCFGKEASSKNKELVEGKQVRLEKDVSETDRYGRLLRFVYVVQVDGSEIDVNDYLVRQGYAVVDSYPPDISRQEEFRSAQKEAQENNRGLWSSCKT